MTALPGFRSSPATLKMMMSALRFRCPGSMLGCVAVQVVKAPCHHGELCLSVFRTVYKTLAMQPCISVRRLRLAPVYVTWHAWAARDTRRQTRELRAA